MFAETATEILFFVFILVTAVVNSYTIRTPYGRFELDSEPRKDKLSGVFEITQGTPVTIAFSSVAKDGFSQLEIADTTGERKVILSYIFNNASSIGYLQIGDAIFVEHMNSGESYYLQKSALPTQLEHLRDGQVYLQSKQQQQQLYTNLDKVNALKDLSSNYNTANIELLSKALGEQLGEEGRNSPSVMSIHLAAKSMAFLERTTRDISGTCPNKEAQFCLNKPIGSDCEGMCGRGTSCWSIICDDCCYHEGCYQHDVCCEKYGYFSWKCLDVTSFSCDSFTC